jgi:hypothetical protein
VALCGIEDKQGDIQFMLGNSLLARTPQKNRVPITEQAF